MKKTNKFFDSKNVKHFEEQEVFRLSQIEAKKCQYEYVNKNLRLAECTVHRKNFSHGIRLFPPHLWNLVDGVVYYKKENKWERWYPNLSANKKRLKVKKKNARQ